MMLSSYSVSQSSAVAAMTRASAAWVAASPRTSQPAAISSPTTAGRIASATMWSTSNVSVAPQMPVRRILALSVMDRAISGFAAPSI